MKFVVNGDFKSSPKTDSVLLKLIARAQCWFDDLVSRRAASMVEIGPPPKFETERIFANGRGISEVGISLVALEFTKRLSMLVYAVFQAANAAQVRRLRSPDPLDLRSRGWKPFLWSMT